MIPRVAFDTFGNPDVGTMISRDPKNDKLPFTVGCNFPTYAVRYPELMDEYGTDVLRYIQHYLLIGGDKGLEQAIIELGCMILVPGLNNFKCEQFQLSLAIDCFVDGRVWNA